MPPQGARLGVSLSASRGTSLSGASLYSAFCQRLETTPASFRAAAGVGSLSNALVRSRWDGDIGRAVAAGQLSLTAALRLPSYKNQGVSF